MCLTQICRRSAELLTRVRRLKTLNSWDCDGHPDASGGLIKIKETTDAGAALAACRRAGGRAISCRVKKREVPGRWYCFKRGTCDIPNRLRLTEKFAAKGCLIPPATSPPPRNPPAGVPPLGDTGDAPGEIRGTPPAAGNTLVTGEMHGGGEIRGTPSAALPRNETNKT